MTHTILRLIRTLLLNAFALLGMSLVFMGLLVHVKPELLELGEQHLYAALHDRTVARHELDVAPEAHQRVTAVDLLDLPEEQAAVAFWLSRKYKVAPEPLGALVAEAYELGLKRNLDPTLILSVMAIESRFNPYAQSAVGAQGLMQVMTQVHEDKYAHFGGTRAAFDPVSNLQVGSLILKDCIDRFGSVRSGLVCYVGAAKLPNDGGYSTKVLAEHARLQQALGNTSKVLPSSFLQALKARRLQQAGEEAGSIEVAGDGAEQMASWTATADTEPGTKAPTTAALLPAHQQLAAQDHSSASAMSALTPLPMDFGQFDQPDQLVSMRAPWQISQLEASLSR
ncbi:transglycosylase SLT domain-containing protein [Corticibacter populi]|nr:transglycosylase SLT domain-containing protein [Corticibacter populi]RZS36123.1 transglycosylase-like protein with SLT domain [Corticibacter populi]